jgi:hypothetical protein
MGEVPKPAGEPAAERLAKRLDAGWSRPTLTAMLRDLGRLDLAVYRAIASTPTRRRARHLRLGPVHRAVRPRSGSSIVESEIHD